MQVYVNAIIHCSKFSCNTYEKKEMEFHDFSSC